MARSIPVREVFPKAFAALLGVGVFFGLSNVGPPAMAVTVGILSAYMAYEDWDAQTIDVGLLTFMWIALFVGSSEKLWFLFRFAFFGLLFRALLLWMMRFSPRDGTEILAAEHDGADKLDPASEKDRLPIGYLPTFFASFALVALVFVYALGSIPGWAFEAYHGFLSFQALFFGDMGLLGSVLLLMVLACAAGEYRRRKHANDYEIWPFGDGDVWFLATWGAALPAVCLFVVCFLSQILQLVLYFLSHFMGGGVADE